MKTLDRRGFLYLGLTLSGAFIAPSLFAQNRSVSYPFVRFETAGDFRVVRTNSKPSHPTGDFPNRHDPYGVGTEVSEFKIPLKPRVAKEPTDIYGSYCRFGVALNGVLFDPAGPQWGDGWHFEVLSKEASKFLGIDENNAHVQPYDRPGGPEERFGEYHYHGIPKVLVDELVRVSPNKMCLIGYAADGYGIYAPYAFDDKGVKKELRSSYKLKTGGRKPLKKGQKAPKGKYDGTFVEDYEFVQNSGDLDEYNGAFGPTPENPQGSYYYVLTNDFPFVPRKLKGEVVDRRFFHKRGPTKGQVPRELLNYGV